MLVRRRGCCGWAVKRNLLHRERRDLLSHQFEEMSMDSIMALSSKEQQQMPTLLTTS